MSCFQYVDTNVMCCALACLWEEISCQMSILKYLTRGQKTLRWSLKDITELFTLSLTAATPESTCPQHICGSNRQEKICPPMGDSTWFSQWDYPNQNGLPMTKRTIYLSLFFMPSFLTSWECWCLLFICNWSWVIWNECPLNHRFY